METGEWEKVPAEEKTEEDETDKGSDWDETEKDEEAIAKEYANWKKRGGSSGKDEAGEDEPVVSYA